MIITRLQGGLGNQLFQYAAGFSLARHLNVDLKVDAYTFLNSQTLRSIELEKFNIPFQFASKNEIKKHIPFPGLYRHKPGFFKLIGKNIFREKHFHYDPHFYNCNDPVLIDGFWQSQKYFEKFDKEIRQQFLVKENLVGKWKDNAAHLQASQSVSVHIRRGDLLNPKAAAYHGILAPKYYDEAIRFLQSKIPNVFFYFFSDDIDWVEKNIRLPISAELMSLRTNSAIEDFYLMSNCSHNIIANSSFSWWAAWLNQNPEKLVIAPKKWFAAEEIDTSDLIPQSWLKF